MKQYKRIIYSCVALLLAVFGGTYAQTKAVPEDPSVPHFIQLESTDGGTLTGQALVNGETFDLQEGQIYSFPHATEIKLTATPDKGVDFVNVIERCSGVDSYLPLDGVSTTFSYKLEKNVILTASFANNMCVLDWFLPHLNANLPSKVAVGSLFQFTLAPEEGYRLPETIKLTLSGDTSEDLVVGEDYTYDNITGAVTIQQGAIKGNLLLIRAEGVRDVQVSMKWNSFSGRYFETNKESTAEYGIKADDRETPLLFRYIIDDFEEWKGALTMEYADNYKMDDPKPFDFSENGMVDIKTSDIVLLPDAYNTYFRFTSTKAGILSLHVEVYNEEGTHMYGMLEDARIMFADPVTLEVSPKLEGLVDTDIEFGIKVKNLNEALSSVGDGKFYFEIYGGLDAEDVVLKYGDSPIKLESKSDILYSSSVVVGPLEEDHLYSFTINSKKPLTAENKIKVSVADSYYGLPIKAGNEILPSISVRVEGPESDRLELEVLGMVEEGEPLDMELKLLEQTINCRLPRTIEVLMGGVILNEGSDYLYNQEDGNIRINEVNGGIEVRAFAVAEEEIEVYYTMKGLDIKYAQETTSRTYAFGEPLPKTGKKEFTLMAKEGYKLPTSITVKVNDKELAVGRYTYEISKRGVLSDTENEQEIAILTISEEELGTALVIDIIAEGTVLQPDPVDPDPVDPVDPDNPVDPDLPTSTEGIEPADLKVWGAYGCLHIQTPVTDIAYIVTFDGRLCKVLSLPVGETVTNLSQGSYIIRIGKQTYKLRF